MQPAASRTQRLPRAQLWAEFVALFVAAPMAMTAFFGLYPLFGALLAITLVSAVLLLRTPGFRPRDLISGPLLGEWRLILAFAAGAAVVTFGLAWLLVPGRFLAMPRYSPELWLTIMLLYPVLSAAPQEVIFRSLFFQRYAHLFGEPCAVLAVNALVFSFAHLFYQNPVALGLTLLGGFIFGWVYVRNRSLPLVVVLHAIAGQLVFTSGLGVYFYHGAIGHTP